jgi:hypothetical protein
VTEVLEIVLPAVREILLIVLPARIMPMEIVQPETGLIAVTVLPETDPIVVTVLPETDPIVVTVPQETGLIAVNVQPETDLIQTVLPDQKGHLVIVHPVGKVDFQTVLPGVIVLVESVPNALFAVVQPDLQWVEHAVSPVFQKSKDSKPVIPSDDYEIELYKKHS